MTGLITFAFTLGFGLIGKFRSFLYGGGAGLLGFFLLQSYGQWNAHFLYERAIATATAVEQGCLSKARDADGNRKVVSCGDAARAFTKAEKPYVAFRFVDAEGRTRRSLGAIGAVGFPRDGRAGDKFDVLYDPHDPATVEAPIGRHYFSLTLPAGVIGALLLALAFFSRRWTRAMAAAADNAITRSAYADFNRRQSRSR